MTVGQGRRQPISPEYHRFRRYGRVARLDRADFAVSANGPVRRIAAVLPIAAVSASVVTT